MSKDQSYIFRLGLFVVIAAALFTAGIYYIGNNKNLFGSSISISSIFSNVSGLQAGNNVRYGGINVGTVDQIQLVNDSTLRVKMNLNKDVMQYIRKDAIASIGTDGLVGNVIVNINRGEGKAPAIEDGDVIQSYSRLETSDMMNTLGKTSENVAIFSNDLLHITEQISKGKGTIAMLLQDSVLAVELRQSVQNIRATSAALRTASLQIKSMADQLENGEGLVQSLLTDTIIMNKLKNIVSKVENADFYEQLDSTMYFLQASGKNMETFSRELNVFMDQVNNEKGIANTVFRDSVAAEDLKNILINLEEGTARFSEDMEALKHNFLFRKYFKKLEKEKRKAEKEKQKELEKK